MKKIGFSGTLDPITNGHMWVIGEARAMADQVVVLLSENNLKRPQFEAHERKRIIEMSTAERGWDDVQVQIVRGSYTAHAAKHAGCDYLIRGIRNTADFDYENLIQQTNVDVLHGAKSIFVMPPRDLGSVSSSFVRALQGPVGWHWHVRKFVPGPAYDAWVRLWLYQEWQQLWEQDAQLFGTTADAAQIDGLFESLVGSLHYGGRMRFYHNVDHLVHGLSELRVWAAYHAFHASDEARVLQLRKAFWFHDAIYRQVSGSVGGGVSNIVSNSVSGNISDEERSAQFWLQSQAQLRSSSCTQSAAQEEANRLDSNQIADLIRVTDHFQEEGIEHPLKAVMLGADLAILGQDEAVYECYAAAIRQEYGTVETVVFARHRCQALRHLCQRARQGRLFLDPYFSGQYNAMALRNMEREIFQWEEQAQV
jgi:pantetheine-phosphate adenylyltransferase